MTRAPGARDDGESDGARPHWSIRAALRDGDDASEEYGGPMDYARRHFGDPRALRLDQEHARLSAYHNVDNGAGRNRGIYLQGNGAGRPILQARLEPFRYLGAATVTAANAAAVVVASLPETHR